MPNSGWNFRSGWTQRDRSDQSSSFPAETDQSKLFDMRKISVDEMRERLDGLLDEVASGQEFEIQVNGKSVSRLLATTPENVAFTDRSALRASLPPVTDDVATSVRSLRDGERY